MAKIDADYIKNYTGRGGIVDIDILGGDMYKAHFYDGSAVQFIEFNIARFFYEIGIVGVSVNERVFEKIMSHV